MKMRIKVGDMVRYRPRGGVIGEEYDATIDALRDDGTADLRVHAPGDALSLTRVLLRPSRMACGRGECYPARLPVIAAG